MMTPREQRIRFNRQVQVKGPGIESGEGEILFEVYQEESAWKCEYELKGLLGDIRRFFRPTGHFFGEDGLQAVQLCLRHLHFLITEFEQYGGSVWWLDEGDHGRLMDTPTALD